MCSLKYRIYNIHHICQGCSINTDQVTESCGEQIQFTLTFSTSKTFNFSYILTMKTNSLKQMIYAQ